MSLRRTVVLIAGATAVMAGGVSFGAAGKPTLTSGKASRAHAPIVSKARTPETQEQLFRGDMAADLGLGCSSGGGTTGGPNDWATKVTAAAVVTPFSIVNTTYNIFSFVSGPTWDIVAWANGGLPGAEIDRQALGAGSGTTGNHTIAIVPPVGPVTTATFFFGLSQGADTQGIRIGMDNGGSTPNTTYIRAPGCGLAGFGTVESIGFPGFWVHRITVDDFVPVELMDFNVS